MLIELGWGLPLNVLIVVKRRLVAGIGEYLAGRGVGFGAAGVRVLRWLVALCLDREHAKRAADKRDIGGPVHWVSVYTKKNALDSTGGTGAAFAGMELLVH